VFKVLLSLDSIALKQYLQHVAGDWIISFQWSSLQSRKYFHNLAEQRADD